MILAHFVISSSDLKESSTQNTNQEIWTFYSLWSSWGGCYSDLLQMLQNLNDTLWRCYEHYFLGCPVHAASCYDEIILLAMCSNGTQHNPDLPQKLWSLLFIVMKGESLSNFPLFSIMETSVGSCSNLRDFGLWEKVYFNFFWNSCSLASEFRQSGFMSHCYHYLGKTYLSLSFPGSYMEWYLFQGHCGDNMEQCKWPDMVPETRNHLINVIYYSFDTSPL